MADAQSATAGGSAEDRLAPGTVMTLVAMGLGVLVIANDFTALNVAIPSIEQDFDTAFSALGAASPNVEALIGCRVGMAIGGAMMWPAILGMTFAALPASRASFAGALILGVAGSAMPSAL